MNSEQTAQSNTDEKLIQDYIAQNGLTALKTEEGLYYVVTKQGEGAKPQTAKKVTVHYTGKLLNGRVFDSSRSPGRTAIEFTLGVGQVIKAWDLGIALFNVGGVGSLLIPSAMGYGTRGAGSSIPPNAVLIFDIEVVGAK